MRALVLIVVFILVWILFWFLMAWFPWFTVYNSFRYCLTLPGVLFCTILLGWVPSLMTMLTLDKELGWKITI